MIARILRIFYRYTYQRNPLNILLGRIIYGNDSSLIENLKCNIILSKNKLHVSKNILKNNSFLKNNGYEKFDNAASSKNIKKLKKNFFNLIKLESKKNNSELKKNLRFDFTSINNPSFFDRFPEVTKILSPKLYEILENYYEGNFNISNVHIYRILKKENKDPYDTRSYGSTIAWHNDGSRVDSLKIFVSLDDINKDSGPMEFISKQETKTIFRKNLFLFRKVSLMKIIDKLKIKKKMTFFDRKIVYIIDTNKCLHRAQSPNSEYRDLLVYYVQSSKTPFNFQWKQSSTKKVY